MRWIILLASIWVVYGTPVISDDISAKLEEIENEFQNLQNDIQTAKDIQKRGGEVHRDPVTTTFGDILTRNEEEDVTGTEEGDIMVPGANDAINDEGIYKRNAVRGSSMLWKSREIPYEFQTGANALSTADQNTIKETLTYMASISCLTFVERTSTDSRHYIKFFMGSGCWSYVGRIAFSQGFQQVSIGRGCAYKGIIMHEVLHALGFYHEQSRYDRDQYVEIKYENILAGRENNFRKKTKDDSRNVGTGYDYSSIMHYGPSGFSKNGQPTIVVNAAKANGLTIGQRGALSADDIASLNRLYHCYNTPSLGNNWTTWSAYGVCHETSTDPAAPCTKKRHRFCPTGNQCPGNEVETADCTDSECKLDGHWGHWGAWSDCSASQPCTQGTKTRSRQCNNPAPRKGGLDCPGVAATDTTPCSANCPRNCTFNENVCGYTWDGLWQKGYGSTRSSGTGPNADVSADTGVGGNYMYIEASSPAITGQISILTSPTFTFPSGKACYHFRYHMYGLYGTPASFGKLSAEVAGQTMWEKEGNQGPIWHQHNFTVSSAIPFQVKFKSVRGTSWRGDSAVDNLVVTDGECGGGSGAIDGNWGLWTQWSACGVTCGPGMRSRSRKCDSPAASNGGRQCLETNGATRSSLENQYEKCQSPTPCPINGNWGPWTLSACSVSCGGGTQLKSRYCDSPPASNGGLECLMSDGVNRGVSEFLSPSCNTQPCPTTTTTTTSTPSTTSTTSTPSTTVTTTTPGTPPTTTPVPTTGANVNGQWASSLGGILNLVQAGTTLTGSFIPNRETFPLNAASYSVNGNIGTGYPTTLGFSVTYQGTLPNDKATCVWSGQILKDATGIEYFYTSWIMSNAITDTANRWNSTSIGREDFWRSSTGTVKRSNRH